MPFLRRILGYRDFTKFDDIKNEIVSKYGEEPDKLDKNRALIFFKTKRQKTWLVATNNKLFCVLDDILTDKFEIRWHLDINEVIDEGGNLILDISIESNYKEKSGRIDFGPNHKNWLYSKQLYPSSENLKSDIKNLVTKK